MQFGILTLLLGIVLIAAGTAISMLIDIYKKLELIPKNGYVLTCALAYVTGSIGVILGILVVIFKY